MHAHESRSRPRSLGVGSGEGVAGWTPITASERGRPRRDGMGVHPSRHRGRPHRRWWASIVGLGFGRPPKRGVVAHMRGVAAPKRETTWTAITHERGLPPDGKMDGQRCLMAAQRGRVWTSIVEGGGRLLAVHCGRKWTQDVGRGGRPSWPYLAVHIGRGWSPIVDEAGRLLAAHRGRRWAQGVGLSGRPHWMRVVAHYGRGWSPIMDGSWTATYPRVGPPPKGAMDGHAGEMAAHLFALAAHLKRAWTQMDAP